MKINRKRYSLFLIIFCIVAVSTCVPYFLHFVGIDIVMLFLGLLLFFIGLSPFVMSPQQIDSKGINKANKGVGVFFIILGCIVIGLIKVIL